MSHIGKNTGLFTRVAKSVSSAAGHPATFIAAVAIVVIWAASGPVFKFGDTWQLVINTGTTIITFLMVFLIQNSQNRDTESMQIKLDELICVVKEANDALLDLEELDQKEIDRIRQCFIDKAKRSHEARDRDANDGGANEAPDTQSLGGDQGR
ncbi:MAG TPA: low affinity iron permease family protein [Pinirhizobacter sp.]|uniref:low affinity iron permease family protein n=1 Tax=Pinirhizobacter sp. TaxID=2950432 RepID=UPI002D1CB8DC|nr:low affinity iron permease family protein [Pinirhizobacter sp.]HMH69632.1 low affinity iron permease family protein [Pinirhizobacter sp.]